MAMWPRLDGGVQRPQKRACALSSMIPSIHACHGIFFIPHRRPPKPWRRLARCRCALCFLSMAQDLASASPPRRTGAHPHRISISPHPIPSHLIPISSIHMAIMFQVSTKPRVAPSCGPGSAPPRGRPSSHTPAAAVRASACRHAPTPFRLAVSQRGAHDIRQHRPLLTPALHAGPGRSGLPSGWPPFTVPARAGACELHERLASHCPTVGVLPELMSYLRTPAPAFRRRADAAFWLRLVLVSAPT